MKKEAKFINCGNDFYQEYFEEVCTELEKGERVHVYIDCIGHTRNNMSQDAYRDALIKHFGDRLNIEFEEGVCSYSYTYNLM